MFNFLKKSLVSGPTILQLLKLLEKLEKLNLSPHIFVVSYQFPEHNRIADEEDEDDDDDEDEIESDPTTTEEDSSSNADDDSDLDSDDVGSDEVIDLHHPAEVRLPQDIQDERELLQHLWMRGGDPGAGGGGCLLQEAYSSSGSSDGEENEVEIMELFNHRRSQHRHRCHQNHAFQPPYPPMEFEEVRDADNEDADGNDNHQKEKEAEERITAT